MNFTLFIIICGGIGAALGMIAQILPGPASKQFVDSLGAILGFGIAAFIPVTLLGGFFAILLGFRSR